MTNYKLTPDAAAAMKETLTKWAHAMAEYTNISDCHVREGGCLDMDGPAIFKALAKAEEVSLRVLGDSCFWDMSSRDAGLRLAAYAALSEMIEEWENGEIIFDDCLNEVEKAQLDLDPPLTEKE